MRKKFFVSRAYTTGTTTDCVEEEEEELERRAKEPVCSRSRKLVWQGGGEVGSVHKLSGNLLTKVSVKSPLSQTWPPPARQTRGSQQENERKKEIDPIFIRFPKAM